MRSIQLAGEPALAGIVPRVVTGIALGQPRLTGYLDPVALVAGLAIVSVHAFMVHLGNTARADIARNRAASRATRARASIGQRVPAVATFALEVPETGIPRCDVCREDTTAREPPRVLAVRFRGARRRLYGVHAGGRPVRIVADPPGVEIALEESDGPSPPGGEIGAASLNAGRQVATDVVLTNQWQVRVGVITHDTGSEAGAGIAAVGRLAQAAAGDRKQPE